MDVIVRTVVRGLVPFAFLFGAAIMFHGHLTPGGSFPGGAVIASGFALVALAFGAGEAEGMMSEKAVHALEGIAVVSVAFVIINETFLRGYSGILGFFNLTSSVQVLALNLAGGVMVLGALAIIIFMLMKE